MPRSSEAIIEALSEPTQWLIVKELAQGPLSVTDLETRLGLEKSRVMNHVQALQDVGAVEIERTGDIIWCSIAKGIQTTVGDSIVLDFGSCSFRID